MVKVKRDVHKLNVDLLVPHYMAQLTRKVPAPRVEYGNMWSHFFGCPALASLS